MRVEEPMGRRDRNNLERRASLLAEARRLFDAQGVEATTVEQIADAAGVALRTVYNFFPTKVDLLAALLSAEVQARMLSRRRRNRALPADPRDGVLALVRALVKTMAGLSKTEQKLVVSRAILAGSDSEAGRYSAEIDVFMRTAICDVLSVYVADGSLGPDLDTGTTASLIFATLNGLYLDWLQSDTELEAIVPLIAVYLDLVLRP